MPPIVNSSSRWTLLTPLVTTGLHRPQKILVTTIALAFAVVAARRL